MCSKRYVFLAILVLGSLSHIRAARADPGIVPKDAEPYDEQSARFVYRECRYCEVRPPNSVCVCLNDSVFDTAAFRFGDSLTDLSEPSIAPFAMLAL